MSKSCNLLRLRGPDPAIAGAARLDCLRAGEDEILADALPLAIVYTKEYTLPMTFEWDEDKNARNVEKHGVSFQTASRIFEGFVLTVEDDRFDYGEDRERSIGMIDGVLFLAVIHTERNGKNRIISARRANRGERRIYEEALRQGTEH